VLLACELCGCNYHVICPLEADGTLEGVRPERGLDSRSGRMMNVGESRRCYRHG
jgi:hypothetical protein